MHPRLAPPGATGLYDPANEHDGCGIALVAKLWGEASHAVVEKALDALESIYVEGREWEPLYEVYARRAELFAGDDDRRRHYLMQLAQLCEGSLDRPLEASRLEIGTNAATVTDPCCGLVLPAVAGLDTRFGPDGCVQRFCSAACALSWEEHQRDPQTLVRLD